MKKKITIEYEEFSSKSSLRQEDAMLLEEATKACRLSHSPFPKFRVGAAVRMSNGEILSAANQESAAFPSGLCAERSVLFYAMSKFSGVAVEAIAIVAKQGNRLTALPTRPCGACLQVLADAENRGGAPLKVILGSSRKIEVFSSVHCLIPFSFDNLK
ncbi:MAG: cytidine deaminase [Bacteroidales bacterium]|nr:cytidine deaminase [Bacteroidales bacterium]